MSIHAMLAAAPLQMPPVPKAVLMWYALRSMDDATAWPSQADTMAGTCLCESAVRRALTTLAALGYLMPTGEKRGHTAVYALMYLSGRTGTTARSKMQDEPVPQLGLPVRQPDEPVPEPAKPGCGTPVRERRETKGEKGTQTRSPHLIITEKTDREKIMDTIKASGAVVRMKTAEQTAGLLQEWETVTEGLTPGQVAAIMAGTKPTPRWPSDFTKAKEALADRPAALMTPEERQAAADRHHADRVRLWSITWKKIAMEWTAKLGPERFAAQRVSLAKEVPADVRNDVCGVA